MLDLERVRARLPGRSIEWFASVDSTMSVAARLAREGCPDGTLVGAEEQTAGVGRHGHSWHSQAGAGLYVSHVSTHGSTTSRTGAANGSPPLVMLALGLAAQQAINEISGLNADLRWPNDVLLDGKKCAGILAHAEGNRMIAGIGINVGHAGFPPEIAPLATSLLLAGAPQISREDLLVALVLRVEEHMQFTPDTIRDRFMRASSYAQGRAVRVEIDHEEIAGITEGLDASGFLIVREASGSARTILTGGVRPA